MIKKKKALPNKRRLNADYNRALCIKVHPDGEAARTRLAEKFKGQYKKYELDTLAFIVLETVIEFAGIKKGDEIEASLNLLNKK